MSDIRRSGLENCFDAGKVSSGMMILSAAGEQRNGERPQPGSTWACGLVPIDTKQTNPIIRMYPCLPRELSLTLNGLPPPPLPPAGTWPPCRRPR
jgi:hypothetical protein